MNVTARMIATFFGIGYLPKMPGTWGSLAVAFLLFGFPPLSIYWQCVIILLVVIVGVWASGIVEKLDAVEDPGYIVIDEVVGVLIAVFALPIEHISVLLTGFIAFRVFDIWKPLGIRKIQNVGGGVGIMIDDIAAGILAWIVNVLIYKSGIFL